jgi:hypothetical protein
MNAKKLYLLSRYSSAGARTRGDAWARFQAEFPGRYSESERPAAEAAFRCRIEAAEMQWRQVLESWLRDKERAR